MAIGQKKDADGSRLFGAMASIPSHSPLRKGGGLTPNVDPWVMRELAHVPARPAGRAGGRVGGPDRARRDPPRDLSGLAPMSHAAASLLPVLRQLPQRSSLRHGVTCSKIALQAPVGARPDRSALGQGLRGHPRFRQGLPLRGFSDAPHPPPRPRGLGSSAFRCVCPARLGGSLRDRAEAEARFPLTVLRRGFEVLQPGV